jgi:hypothetical protein
VWRFDLLAIAPSDKTLTEPLNTDNSVKSDTERQT